MKKLIFISTLIVVGLSSDAESDGTIHWIEYNGTTNKFFLTYSDGLFAIGDSGKRVVSMKKWEEAKTALESRPAQEDPIGNWGEVLAGFQISFRLTKDKFKVGEEIVGVALVRNVSAKDKELPYLWANDRDFEVIITDEKDSLLTDKQATPFRARRAYLLQTGTQYRWEIDLGKRFDLSKPGKYSVTVKHGIFNEGRTAETNVVSGTATFEIQ